MCGITGTLYFESGNIAERMATLGRQVTQMERRGPDDEGVWYDADGHCFLGFRRLAILDLSPSGHQPMHTLDGRYTLVYNGELYNFQELREQLAARGVRFRSTGDAEVILYALAEWGSDALACFNGMFALAFYDCVDHRLLLARDHAGIKPLYYSQTSAGLIFASQYDQILAHSWNCNPLVSSHTLSLYLRLGYIPAPYALLEQTHLLEPGTWLEVTSEGKQRRGRHFEFPLYGVPDLFGMEAYEAVDAAVTAAVKRQMISDVPIGTFLSGGIDSPLVAAKMQTTSTRPIQAFTIGTNGDPLDESVDAAGYAGDLGVDHCIEHIAPDNALAMVDDVIAACGEPFADYSIFPTLLVSRLARRQVKVMLSGDGGDELFWGYAGRFGSVLQKATDFKDPHWWRSVRWGAKKWLGMGNGYYNLRIPTLGDWYRAKHTRLPESWRQRIFPDLSEEPVDFSLFSYQGWEPDRVAQWLRWNEFVGHLTMVLLKVDRASMYHSLEVRVPLLDREVIDVATRVDWRSCLDLNSGTGKLPLRYSLARHVRRQTQTKRGFSVPMGAWLRGPLRPLIEDSLLQRNELLGYPMNRAALANMFQEHLHGQVDHAWGLWVLLSLALWEARHWRPKVLPANLPASKA